MGSQWIAYFGYGFGGGVNAGATTAGMMGSVAGIAAGAGIGLMGGKLISGGYSAWGNSGNRTVGAGTAAGAAIGSIVPGLGTALGAAVGGLLGGVFNRAFGRGPKKYGDTTFVGDFDSLGFSGYTSTPWKQKGGWFSSGRSGTQVGTLDQTMVGDLGAAFDLMKTNAVALAKAVGVSAQSLDTYSEQNGLRQVVNALTGKAVAAFAKGGDHAGGLRLVGERGPELEVTGPSRIFSAERTQAILSGGGNQELLLAELRALRQSNEALRAEVASLRIEARATASNTGKTARQLDRLEMDGMLVRTEAGAPLQVEGT